MSISFITSLLSLQSSSVKRALCLWFINSWSIYRVIRCFNLFYIPLQSSSLSNSLHEGVQNWCLMATARFLFFSFSTQIEYYSLIFDHLLSEFTKCPNWSEADFLEHQERKTFSDFPHCANLKEYRAVECTTLVETYYQFSLIFIYICVLWFSCLVFYFVNYLSICLFLLMLHYLLFLTLCCVYFSIHFLQV